MAYGNWGAWVFKNGEHMSNWEDQTPYREEDTSGSYLQAFGAQVVGTDEEGRPVVERDPSLNPHHAVLGGKEMRLCGYKSSPALYYRLEEVDLATYLVEEAPEGTWDAWAVYQGEIAGYRFRAEQESNFVELLLIEPDGTRWTSRCGYEYGAGHHDEPRDRASIEWADPGGSVVREETPDA